MYYKCVGVLACFSFISLPCRHWSSDLPSVASNTAWTVRQQPTYTNVCRRYVICGYNF
jgi:hypothetical protein